MCEVCVRWPLWGVSPEQAEEAQGWLHDLMSQVDPRWNERDTIDRVIIPILERLLEFPRDSLYSTINPPVYYGDANSRLEADITNGTDVVIEAKRIRVALMRRYSDSDREFSSAIDQGLTYLDNYDVHTAFITNGWDWYLFKKNYNWNQFTGLGVNYFGVRFRLDIPAQQKDLGTIAKFIGLFNINSLRWHPNNTYIVENHSYFRLRRNLYDTNSHLYIKDFASAPLFGRGSGFHW